MTSEVRPAVPRSRHDERRAKSPLADIQRLLAIRLDNVGDVVMLSAALRALNEALPRAAITLMATPAGAQVAPLLPWVEDVIVTKPLWQDLSGALELNPAREQALIAELAERHFDAAMIFTSFTQSPFPPAFVCYLAGIPVRVGQSREFGGGVLSHAIEPLSDSTHQAERNLHLVESLNIVACGRHLELHPDRQHQREASELLRAAGLDAAEPYLVLAPGASCQARRYPAERFAELTALVARQTGLPIAVLGSPAESELCRQVAQQAESPRVVSLAGKTSVPVYAAILATARLVIANNSSAMHMADALTRPMVILYSGTELEEQWRPRTSPARLLRRPTPCQPCHRFACPYRMECLDFAPAIVAGAVDELLESTATADECSHRLALLAD